jgi:hypothetical protein
MMVCNMFASYTGQIIRGLNFDDELIPAELKNDKKKAALLRQTRVKVFPLSSGYVLLYFRLQLSKPRN